MNNDGIFLQNYSANNHIWNSNAANPSDKANAWRKQSLLIEHLSRNSDAETYYELMKHHIQKLDTSSNKDFVKERVNAVEHLLKDFENTSKQTVSNDVFDETIEIDDIYNFEEACHSEYESCRNDEVTKEQLLLLIEKKPITNDFNDKSKSYMELQSAGSGLKNIEKSSISKFLLDNSTSRNQIEPLQNNNNLKKKLDCGSPNEINSIAKSEFRTAREELMLQNLKKYGSSNSNTNSNSAQAPLFNYGQTKKSLGARRTFRSGFVLPIRSEDTAAAKNNLNMNQNGPGLTSTAINSPAPITMECSPPVDPSPPLANIDPKMVELITNEIMHKYKSISWDDIAGLEYAKSIIKEAVVYPLLRPDIFTGLRRPPRGILLFGPPGTGKTLIGKCIASQSHSTFFSISASSLTSKWIGDGEKMVRALFAVAAVHQPSVVFIDEIDSLLSQRSESEHESSRRLKNEFLIQLDGAATSEDDRILIVGATNRPQELDEAARRRLVRRLYIPLPEHEARVQILRNLLKTVRNSLSADEIEEIGKMTSGYSGADMDSLCREASMEPIRLIPADLIAHFKEDNVRPVNINDFETAISNVRPSVSPEDLKQYLEWNRIYGAKR